MSALAAITRASLGQSIQNMTDVAPEDRETAVARLKAMYGRDRTYGDDEIKLYLALKEKKSRVTPKLMNTWRTTVENSVVVSRGFFVIAKSDKPHLDQVEEVKDYITPWCELLKVPSCYKAATRWVLGDTCPTGSLGRQVTRVSLNVALKQDMDVGGGGAMTSIDDWAQDHALPQQGISPLALEDEAPAAEPSASHRPSPSPDGSDKRTCIKALGSWLSDPEDPKKSSCHVLMENAVQAFNDKRYYRADPRVQNTAEFCLRSYLALLQHRKQQKEGGVEVEEDPYEELFLKGFIKALLDSGAYSDGSPLVKHLQEVAKVRGQKLPKLGQAVVNLCTQELTGNEALASDLDGKQWLMLYKGQFYADYMAARRQALYEKALKGTAMPAEQRLKLIVQLREEDWAHPGCQGFTERGCGNAW